MTTEIKGSRLAGRKFLINVAMSLWLCLGTELSVMFGTLA